VHTWEIHSLMPRLKPYHHTKSTPAGHFIIDGRRFHDYVFVPSNVSSSDIVLNNLYIIFQLLLKRYGFFISMCEWSLLLLNSFLIMSLLPHPRLEHHYWQATYLYCMATFATFIFHRLPRCSKTCIKPFHRSCIITSLLDLSGCILSQGKSWHTHPGWVLSLIMDNGYRVGIVWVMELGSRMRRRIR
jgi:hypothetical protein